MLAAGLVLLGAAWRVSCLGADGLTLGEAARPGCYSDVIGLFQGRGLSADPLPYAEVVTEYPPLTALQWWVAGAFTQSVTGFFLVTALVQALAAAIVVVVLRSTRLGVSRVLLFAGAPTLVVSGTTNWDLVAVALMLGGLVASHRGKDTGAGVLLGLGGLAKLFPLVAVPATAWAAAARSGRPGAVRVLGAAAVTVLVVQVPVALWAPSGWSAWLELNSQRPVDWDTAWYGLQVLSGRVLSIAEANVLVAAAVTIGWAVMVAWTVQSRRPGPDGLKAPTRPDPRALVLPLLIWVLLAGKVYSPQFSLWLLGLLALSQVPAWLVWTWLVADVAVWVVRAPFLAGQQGLEPSLPYSVFAVSLALRGALLLGIMWHSLVDAGVLGRPGGSKPMEIQHAPHG
ncbi:MAG: glycosyltransferase 87 family protein [Euzebya sp.]